MDIEREPLESKPLLGISACLMGERVRYNGEHKGLGRLCGVLDERFELVRICPEVAVGLGVPRPPVQLVEDTSAVRVRGVDDPDRDVTGALADYADEVVCRHGGLAGYLFKSRSPSCGVADVPVHRADGTVANTGQGGYAGALLAHLPSLPAIQEDALNDAIALDRFFAGVYARHRFAHCMDDSARRHFHRSYALALRARGRSDERLAVMVESSPQAYIAEVLLGLQQPVIRRLDAEILQALCGGQATPLELERYTAGTVSRRVAVTAVAALPDTATDAEWFLNPFPHELPDLCASA